MHAILAAGKPPACQRHQRRLEPTQVEAITEREPHVPRAIEIAHDV